MSLLNCKIYPSTTNTAPALVLIHGFCESLSVWEPVAEELSKTAKYTIISIDLPGFGGSPIAAAETPSLDSFAKDVYDTLKSIHIDSCVMIGHSLGGYVSLAFAEQFPKMLRGLGLFHSTAYADSPEKKEMRSKAIAFLENYGSEKFTAGFFQGLFSPSNKQHYADEIEALNRQAGQIPSQALIHAVAAMQNRPDRSHLLAKLSIPIFFFIGKEDQAVPLADSLAQCHLAQYSVVHILENVGHTGMVESFGESIRAIGGFMGVVI